jgi:hypothetical protein
LRDPSVAFDVFKAGNVDWRIENAAKNWATGYNFPAVRDQQVLLEEFPIRSDRGRSCRGSPPGRWRRLICSGVAQTLLCAIANEQDLTCRTGCLHPLLLLL